MTLRKRAAITAAGLWLVGFALPAFAIDTPDAWITTKVKMALLTTEDVGSTSINVDTIDGRVTLHGTVDSEQEKAKAEQAARQIDGVREVRNLLSVVPPAKQDAVAIADEAIQDNVDKALDKAPDLDDSSITVSSVNKGTVVLSGTAATMSDKLRAVEIAYSVPGVRHVATEVTGPDQLTDVEIWQSQPREKAAGEPREKAAGDAPRNAATGTMSDAWITSAAKVRLIANADTPALDINVDTRDGVVTLFGMVPTEEAKRAAEAEVHKVSGVQKINNELRVVPDSQQQRVEAKDEDIKANLAKRLDAGVLEDDDINIEVSAGVVRLTGSVDNQSERLRALTVARATPGVRSVVDDLDVPADSRASR
jgi:hyperosmotically inducible protein